MHLPSNALSQSRTCVVFYYTFRIFLLHFRCELLALELS